ncbi:MAG: hydrogenase maturation nickel metallochaperone HypA [Bacteroidetes bacterium]|nr:hydrogenase maturation nickel metallochaperone HypA [Bacteroidota bacterium]
MSLALGIIDLAEEETKKAEAVSVAEIELEIGELSGVVVEALEFALEVAVKETVLDGAKRIIHKISGQAGCNDCQNVFSVSDLYTPCPLCCGFNTRIIRGLELRVKSLIVP